MKKLIDDTYFLESVLDKGSFKVKRTFVNRGDHKIKVTRLQNTFKLFCNTELNASINGYFNFIAYMKFVVMIEDDWIELHPRIR